MANANSEYDLEQWMMEYKKDLENRRNSGWYRESVSLRKNVEKSKEKSVGELSTKEKLRAKLIAKRKALTDTKTDIQDLADSFNKLTIQD